MTNNSSCVILAQKMHKKNFFGGNHCSFHVLYINSDSNLKWKISLQWHFNPIAFNLEPFQQVTKRSTILDTMEHNGTYFSTANAKAEHSTTISCLSLMTTRTYPSSSFTENSITSIVLSQEDVLPALQNLNPAKSPGTDNFHPMIMKECANELAPSLCMFLK